MTKALRLAASVIKWTTRETFDQIPSSTSALEVKRYIDVLLYFKKRKWIDENRLKKLSIQNPVQFALAMFWSKCINLIGSQFPILCTLVSIYVSPSPC